MQIVYLGSYCFKIRAKKQNIIAGPLGEKTPRIKAEIVVSPGKGSQNYLKRIKGDPFFIYGPGEYEISGVSVFGSPEAFIIEVAGIKFCYLNQSEVGLTEKQIEELDNIDVLTMLIGEKGLGIEKGAQIAAQVQPKILIPVDKTAIKKFFKELGYEKFAEEEKITISKNNLPEDMKVIVLKSKNG